MEEARAEFEKSEYERKKAHKRRREEAKQRKKKLIEESGGVRPRKPKQEETQKPASASKSKAPSAAAAAGGGAAGAVVKKTPTIQDHGNQGKQQQQQTNHRFGRVMDSIPCRNCPRTWTLSIAIPGSIVANCQTKELKTHLVGQIARAATIYHVDEIIVYDDKLCKEDKPNSFHNSSRQRRGDPKNNNTSENNKDAAAAPTENGDDTTNRPPPPYQKTDPHAFFARVLQYCEIPQYLRRQFFPMHTDLQFAGLLSPMDAPHHVRADDHCKYREGVVMDNKRGRSTRGGGGSMVNCGIPNRPVEIATKLQPGIRCTVKLDPASYKKTGPIQGEVVSPSAPRLDDGTYWGYTTRTADSLLSALNDCPLEGGRYDLKIGTSERGSLDMDDNTTEFALPSFQHALIVFGGVAGIEECVDADESIKLAGSSSHELFDRWINICKYQASRTIRTEEAVLIALAKLSPKLMHAATGGGGAASNNNNNDDDDDEDHKQQRTAGKKAKKQKREEEKLPIPPIDFDDEESVSEESSDDGQ